MGYRKVKAKQATDDEDEDEKIPHFYRLLNIPIQVLIGTYLLDDECSASNYNSAVDKWTMLTMKGNTATGPLGAGPFFAFRYHGEKGQSTIIKEESKWYEIIEVINKRLEEMHIEMHRKGKTSKKSPIPLFIERVVEVRSPALLYYYLLILFYRKKKNKQLGRSKVENRVRRPTLEGQI